MPIKQSDAIAQKIIQAIDRYVDVLNKPEFQSVRILIRLDKEGHVEEPNVSIDLKRK